MLLVVGIVGFRYEYMYVYGMKGGWIQDRQRITGGKGGGGKGGAEGWEVRERPVESYVRDDDGDDGA